MVPAGLVDGRAGAAEAAELALNWRASAPDGDAGLLAATAFSAPLLRRTRSPPPPPVPEAEEPSPLVPAAVVSGAAPVLAPLLKRRARKAIGDLLVPTSPRGGLGPPEGGRGEGVPLPALLRSIALSPQPESTVIELLSAPSGGRAALRPPAPSGADALSAAWAALAGEPGRCKYALYGLRVVILTTCPARPVQGL